MRLPEEIAFFLRSAVYALAVAIVYWFITYETAGTVLLGGFGVAALVLTLALVWRRPGRGSADELAERPFTDESGAVPVPTYAPLEVGAGLTLLVLTVPFGPAMALAAVVPLAAGALGWLRAVEAEPRDDAGRE
jgi:hypothetical protein